MRLHEAMVLLDQAPQARQSLIGAARHEPGCDDRMHTLNRMDAVDVLYESFCFLQRFIGSFPVVFGIGVGIVHHHFSDERALPLVIADVRQIDCG